MKPASLHLGAIMSRFAREGNTWLTDILFNWLMRWYGRSELEGAQESLNLCLCPYDQIVDGAYYQNHIVDMPISNHNTDENVIKLWNYTLEFMNLATKGNLNIEKL